MDYEKFISHVVKQDSRNTIKKCNRTFQEFKVPVELEEFYKNVDIVDVEVVLKDLCSIKFYSLSELSDLQTEYGLNAGSYVFATNEGDPIFIKDGKVFSAVHGIGEYISEIKNSSFDEFMNEMICNMK